MIIAKVKYPYKKEWEKDMGYGQSAPITFQSEEIGDYKQYVSATDPQKNWIRELKKGEKVTLEPNQFGNGYIVKHIEVQENLNNQSNEYDQVKSSAKILGNCVKEIEKEIADAQTAFTSEDVRSLAISMFIQLMRSKKSGYEYSVN